jgi:hypothetical protein
MINEAAAGATMAALGTNDGKSLEAEMKYTAKTRSYQAEMFEESMRRNIIVAVGAPSRLSGMRADQRY